MTHPENTEIDQITHSDMYKTKAERHLSVRVVENILDFQAAMMVRATVWMTRSGATTTGHYDGADFNSSHLLARIGDEPVGTLRIRWFADFARFERLSVREEYRRPSVLFRLADVGIQLCRMKGYRTIVSLAEERGLKFWLRRGAVVTGSPMSACGVTTIPMRMDLDASPHPGLARGAAAGDAGFEAAMSLSDQHFLSYYSTDASPCL